MTALAARQPVDPIQSELDYPDERSAAKIADILAELYTGGSAVDDYAPLVPVRLWVDRLGAVADRYCDGRDCDLCPVCAAVVLIQRRVDAGEYWAVTEEPGPWTLDVGDCVAIYGRRWYERVVVEACPGGVRAVFYRWGQRLGEIAAGDVAELSRLVHAHCAPGVVRRSPEILTKPIQGTK